MATVVVVSLLFGKTYAKHIMTREEESCMYWMTVASYGVLALLTIGGLFLCPLR